MRLRALLPVTVVSAVLVALPLATASTATAKRAVETVDRSVYDATPTDTAGGGIHIGGPARGELGAQLDVVVVPVDGSLPVGSNVCEPAVVTGDLSLPSGEHLWAQSRGDLCTTFAGDGMTISAPITRKHFEVSGVDGKTQLVGEGLLSASVTSWFGGQAGMTVTVRR